SKSSSKTKPVLKVSKSLQKNASKSSQNKSFRKSSYYYEDEGEDADEDVDADEYEDVDELNPNQKNIQNDDNDDNNDTSPLFKSSRSQNQKNITFEDNVDNSSTYHTAANILEMISEDNNEDNDSNDDRQHNDIYTLDNDTYCNDNEEFQLGICLLSLDLSPNLILKLFKNANSLIAISSNEYDRKVQSEKPKEKLREHEASQIPAEFVGMNNILEICNWLVKHPSILQLANQMYMASSSSIENIGTFNESSMPSSAISAHIWDKEIKCLFLRARFPPATCIDEFVKKIFGHPPYSKEGTEIRTKTKNTQGAASLTKENINNYINEKVTMDVLNRFIGGTNQRELQKCDAIKKLVRLIREMFKIHWQGKNIDQVKNLDNLTKNMHVPSRSGLDIVSKLNFN
ncbi:hypothetical protein C2G38_2175376, partial [Gigaspora rosea]